MMQLIIDTRWHINGQWVDIPAGTKCEVVKDLVPDAREVRDCLYRHSKNGETWVAVELHGGLRCVPRKYLMSASRKVA